MRGLPVKNILGSAFRETLTASGKMDKLLRL